MRAAVAVIEQLREPGGDLTPHPRGPVKRGTCGTCTHPVLLVQLPGHRFVILEAAEVIPPMPCPLCKQIEQRGHDRGWCWRCGGTSIIGDPLPQPGIAIGPDGRARVYGGRRNSGEAVHRLHPCPL